jgi:predicted ABC-type ATPase
VRLDLVVGPNGAGKTTFVRYVVSPEVPGSVFVNADVIAAERWPDDPERHSYDAAKIAEETRTRLIDLRRPFIAETVFSHPSKLELVRTAGDAGYYVALHVVMVPEEVSVARVAARVVAGGHSVPEDKVRERHRRLWAIVAEAATLADTTTFWDNSSSDGPRQAALLAAGMLVGNTSWPSWVPTELTDRWR